jgi:nucleotide-binding universal stress UspA family protein
MSPQGVILVPLDGSDLAGKALRVAVELPRRTGAALRLVHVHAPITAEPIHVEGVLFRGRVNSSRLVVGGAHAGMLVGALT